MSFAKNSKIVLIAAASLITSGAAFAAADSATASLSPFVQMDYDNAHRDANAYADAKKAAKVDERLLVNRANEGNVGDSAQVAQAKSKDKAAK